LLGDHRPDSGKPFAEGVLDVGAKHTPARRGGNLTDGPAGPVQTVGGLIDRGQALGCGKSVQGWSFRKSMAAVAHTTAPVSKPAIIGYSGRCGSCTSRISTIGARSDCTQPSAGVGSTIDDCGFGTSCPD